MIININFIRSNILIKKENKYDDMKNHIKALAGDPKFGEKSHFGISDKDWNADAYRCGFLDVVDIIDRYMPELDIYDKVSKRRK